MTYKLPKGFRWVRQEPEYLSFEHIASEKRGAVSGLQIKVGGNIQGAVYYMCAKLLHELARDEVWLAAGRDRDEYGRRVAAGEANERFLELAEATKD